MLAIYILNCNSLLILYFSFGVFSSRGDRCVLSPLPCLNGAPVDFFWVPMPPLAVYSCGVIGLVRYVVGEGGVCGGWVIFYGLVFPSSAYLNRFSPVTSSLWGRCTLIQCAGTLDPRIQWCVARTKVITILLLTYPHIVE